MPNLACFKHKTSGAVIIRGEGGGEGGLWSGISKGVP